MAGFKLSSLRLARVSSEWSIWVLDKDSGDHNFYHRSDRNSNHRSAGGKVSEGDKIKKRLKFKVESSKSSPEELLMDKLNNCTIKKALAVTSPPCSPSPQRGCVRIVVFVAADFSLRNRDVEFQWLTSIWTATTSKHDYDTVSKWRGGSRGWGKKRIRYFQKHPFFWLLQCLKTSKKNTARPVN